MSTEQETIQSKSQRSEGIPCWEWASPDKLDAIGWPLALIWAGVVLLFGANLGYSEAQGWSLFFLGAGMLTLVGIAIRLLVPAYRRSVFGDLIWASFQLGLGTGGWSLILPLVLIAIGASILLRGLFRSPQSI